MTSYKKILVYVKDANFEYHDSYLESIVSCETLGMMEKVFKGLALDMPSLRPANLQLFKKKSPRA
jgi:hypothetical protein